MLTFHKPLADLTDQDLWMKIRAGDEQAFTGLFERYHRTLYNYGCKLTSHTGVVEDGVQDVFIQIWKSKDSLTSDIISVKFYLYRSLRRRIHLLQSRVLQTEELNTGHDDALQSGLPDSEAVLIDQEAGLIRMSRIRKLLSALPERQIEALTLRYFEEFSIEEIALIMGVTEKSVRNFIYKALTSLRQYREALFASWLIICILLFF